MEALYAVERRDPPLDDGLPPLGLVARRREVVLRREGLQLGDGRLLDAARCG